jgi:hypothetical protein
MPIADLTGNLTPIYPTGKQAIFGEMDIAISN